MNSREADSRGAHCSNEGAGVQTELTGLRGGVNSSKKRWGKRMDRGKPRASAEVKQQLAVMGKAYIGLFL